MISVNELNFVLDTFFYFKSPGNIIAHINIKSKESINLKKINEDILNINLLLFNMDNNNNFNSINHYNNINDGTNENINVIITNEIINSNNNIDSEINENITEKIINNKENKKEDWLEIENDINKEKRNIISKIKEKILGDFYESFINEKLNIIKILNKILKNDYKDIYIKNTPFNRGLSLYIDELVGKNNFKIDFSEYNVIKDIIIKTIKTIKSIEKSEISFRKFKLELNKNIYSHTKIYIKQYLKNLYTQNSKEKLISLKYSYSQIIDDLMAEDISFNCFNEIEKNSFLLSIILPEIKTIELNNLNIFIRVLQKSIKKYFIIENIKIIIEELYKEIKKSIEIKQDNSIDLLSAIKKFSKTKKKIPNSFIDNMDHKRLFDVIAKLFENGNIELTKNIYSDISLESLLYFYQNNNIK